MNHESYPRMCRLCGKTGSTYYRSPEVFQYSVRHYAHAWCLAEEKGVEKARAVVHEHQRTLFDAALKKANEGHQKCHACGGDVPSYPVQRACPKAATFGAICAAAPAHASIGTSEAKTPIRIYPNGRRRHDLANAIAATACKGTPVVVVATAEQERAFRRMTEKFLAGQKNVAPVTYERPKGEG